MRAWTYQIASVETAFIDFKHASVCESLIMRGTQIDVPAFRFDVLVYILEAMSEMNFHRKHPIRIFDRNLLMAVPSAFPLGNRGYSLCLLLRFADFASMLNEVSQYISGDSFERIMNNYGVQAVQQTDRADFKVWRQHMTEFVAKSQADDLAIFCATR